MWKSEWGGVLGAEAPKEFFFSREPCQIFLCMAKIIVSFPKPLLVDVPSFLSEELAILISPRTPSIDQHHPPFIS